MWLHNHSTIIKTRYNTTDITGHTNDLFWSRMNIPSVLPKLRQLHRHSLAFMILTLGKSIGHLVGGLLDFPGFSSRLNLAYARILQNPCCLLLSSGYQGVLGDNMFHCCWDVSWSLATVGSARILSCKVTIFPLKLKNILWKDTLAACRGPVSYTPF